MKYNIVPEVSVYDLEDAIKLQYDVEINITELFWESVSNDCYLRLGFRCKDEVYTGFNSEYEENCHLRNLVRGYLRDVMPTEYSYILVDVSW